MNKIVLCIPTTLAWMLLLSPGQAQQAPTRTISTQRQNSAKTTYPSKTQKLQAKKDCYSGHTYRPSNPIRTIQSPTPQRRRSVRTAVWQDLRSPGATSSSSIDLHESELSNTTARSYQTTLPKRPIVVEAQGWTRDEKGRVFLTSRSSRFRKYGATPSNGEC